MELTTTAAKRSNSDSLFMMSKIQNLNGTHNTKIYHKKNNLVVYDVKDTKFEWNSQLFVVWVFNELSCL